jgi:hypothetical protein
MELQLLNDNELPASNLVKVSLNYTYNNHFPSVNTLETMSNAKPCVHILHERACISLYPTDLLYNVLFSFI